MMKISTARERREFESHRANLTAARIVGGVLLVPGLAMVAFAALALTGFFSMRVTLLGLIGLAVSWAGLKRVVWPEHFQTEGHRDLD